jgi:hypothetical protein
LKCVYVGFYYIIVITIIHTERKEGIIWFRISRIKKRNECHGKKYALEKWDRADWVGLDLGRMLVNKTGFFKQG